MSGAVLQGQGVNCVCHALAVLLRESSRESFGGWKLGGLDDALDTQKCLRASNARIRGFSIHAASVSKILGSSLSYPRAKPEDDAVGAPRLVLGRWGQALMRRSATPRRQSAKPQWDVGRPAVNFYIEVLVRVPGDESVRQ